MTMWNDVDHIETIFHNIWSDDILGSFLTYLLLRVKLCLPRVRVVAERSVLVVSVQSGTLDRLIRKFKVHMFS